MQLMDLITLKHELSTERNDLIRMNNCESKSFIISEHAGHHVPALICRFCLQPATALFLHYIFPTSITVAGITKTYGIVIKLNLGSITVVPVAFLINFP